MSLLEPMQKLTSVEDALFKRVAEFFSPLQLPGALPPGWALTEQETDQGIVATFHGPDGGMTVELEGVDAQRPCFARTQRFNVYYSVLQRDRGRLSASELALLDAVIAHVRQHESAFDAVALDDRSPFPSARVQVREVRVSRALVTEGPAAYYLNPYVGCMIGCPYCYAAHRGDLSRSLQGLPMLPWGQWLDVKSNLPQVLADEVARLTPGNVRMSPIITDPYQRAEKRFTITRQCLEVLNAAQFSPMVLTRDSLVLRDLDLLKANPGAKVGFSIGTDNDAVGDAVEPRAEPMSERFRTLRTLRDAGVYTFAMVTPVLPMDPARFVELLAPLIHVVHLGQLFEKDRIAATLGGLGLDGPLDDAWEARTLLELEERFTAAGVQVNPREPPWTYVQ